MAHDWESNVVGGVGAPRFVLCDGSAQLVTNGDLEVNADGWLNAGTRVADALTPFGDYAYQVAGDFTTIHTPTVGTLANRTFVVSFFMRSTEPSETMGVYISAPPEYYNYQVTGLSNTEYKQYIHVFTWGSGQTYNEFKIKFGPTTGDFHIDRIRCWEVTHDIDAMPLASEDSYDFLQLLQARTVRADQTITDYVLGWRFMAELKHDLLTVQQEIWRTQISEADLVLFQPHIDAGFVATCLWDEKRYRRRYFHGRYLGHAGAIELIGLDLLAHKPVEIVT